MMLQDVDVPTAMTAVPVRVQRLWRRGLAITLLALASTQTLAATVVVTSTADSGAGSLRQALLGANAGDTVTFNLTLPATIKPLSTLTIDKNLTVQGPGPDSLVVEGGSTTNTLVRVNQGVTATIAGLTVTNGAGAFNSPSGLLNSGTTTLSNCAITDGVGLSHGGIYNGGDLTIRACVISGNRTTTPSVGGGGAVYNTGTLRVERSTIIQNSARFMGGAVYNSGSVTISDSYVHHNIAYDDGGAIANTGALVIERSSLYGNRSEQRGGAIFHWGSAFSMEGSTVAENFAKAGGAVFSAIPMTITGSTVARNTATLGGAAFFNFDSFTLSRSIVESNGCGGSAPITSAGDNLAYLASGCLSESQPLNDRILDPLLQAVADNGGPMPTMMPGARSPAIDEVRINACSGVDQRGISRPQGPRCDIGAVEAPDADVIFKSGFDL